MPHTERQPRLSVRQRSGLRWVWSLGGLRPLDLAQCVLRQVLDNYVFDRAAQLSFYFILALFPLLIFLSALVGFFISSDTDLYIRLLGYASAVMPAAAFQVLQGALAELASDASGAKLSIGLLVTLWTASSGMDALIKGLNSAYDIREFRPWWRRRRLAIGMTVALGLSVSTALVLLLWGRQIGVWVAAWLGLGELFEGLWAGVTWAAMIGFLLLVLSLIYRFGPNLKNQSWQAVLPGSAVAIVLWLSASAGLKLYLAHFDSYAKTYGSLGAIIALLVWLYITGFAILVGGEVNSEIHKAAARAGSEEAKVLLSEDRQP